MNPAPLRYLVAAANLSLAAGCLFAVWPSSTPAKSEPPAPVAAAPLPWTPPAWFPAETAERLWVLEELEGDGAPTGPRVRSEAAIVADLDRGEILWSRDADSPRSIASLTKVFSSLALAAADPGLERLDRPVCVGPEQWPSRPGARSKFSTGECHRGWEYLGGALVASDNRGAFSLPAVAGEDFHDFVGRMTSVSRELRARDVSFSDPAGLEDENTATARDVLKGVVALAAHPDLAAVASAQEWRIEGDRGPRVLHTTNKLVDRYDTLAAKTGYTDTARYCFATVVQTDSGRTLASVVLGAPNSNARFQDTVAMLSWAESH